MLQAKKYIFKEIIVRHVVQQVIIYYNSTKTKYSSTKNKYLCITGIPLQDGVIILDIYQHCASNIN